MEALANDKHEYQDSLTFMLLVALFNLGQLVLCFFTLLLIGYVAGRFGFERRGAVAYFIVGVLGSGTAVIPFMLDQESWRWVILIMLSVLTLKRGDKNTPLSIAKNQGNC